LVNWNVIEEGLVMGVCRVMAERWNRGFVAIALAGAAMVAAAQSVPSPSSPIVPVTPDTPAGAALVEQLREGGLVMYFRHADTTGTSCDRSYRIGDRAGQRNISEDGREQSRRIGAAMRDLGIPVHWPALAGPVFRARDTAELAFGVERVEVTDSLLADDYAGSRVRWVIAEHRRLFGEPVAPGGNRVLVGHRTPGIMAIDRQVARDNFPEGAALIIAPNAGDPLLIGVLALAPIPGAIGDLC
jgi:phosphohistidine phosphatase SixA